MKDVDLFEIDKGTFGELLANALSAPRFAPTMQAVAELSRMPCYAHLETDELVDLAERGAWAAFSPGETILQQGEPGDAFYAISAGQVEVLEDETRVRTMGPGSHFGEIALLLDTPRTASVRALTPVRTFRLDRAGFDKLVRDAFRAGTVNPVIALERVEEH